MTAAGTQFRFKVTIDGKDIGEFTSLEGLSAEYTVMPYSEGGENRFEHRLPGQLKYSTIKLSRALDPESALAAGSRRSKQKSSRSPQRRTAAITAIDPDGEELASWDSRRYPFKLDRAFVRRQRDAVPRRPSSSVTTGSSKQ